MLERGEGGEKAAEVDLSGFLMNHNRKSACQLGLSTGLPWCFSGKESACQSRRRGFDPWDRKIP